MFLPFSNHQVSSKKGIRPSNFIEAHERLLNEHAPHEASCLVDIYKSDSEGSLLDLTKARTDDGSNILMLLYFYLGWVRELKDNCSERLLKIDLFSEGAEQLEKQLIDYELALIELIKMFRKLSYDSLYTEKNKNGLSAQLIIQRPDLMLHGKMISDHYATNPNWFCPPKPVKFSRNNACVRKRRNSDAQTTEYQDFTPAKKASLNKSQGGANKMEMDIQKVPANVEEEDPSSSIHCSVKSTKPKRR
ncbi:MAG: hypothetical protein CMF48_01270 [Legionellales bacterium]|nr:hypothetical protein [Legionellales bacterium]|tara:strand:- start:748 stop:1488 length:741 start_codon:yes stop_codon:yes gene_type:complete